jgi:hypothetical protein
MSRFTAQVQHLHAQLAPEISIESFVGYLRPKAVGLADKSQFFAPLRFAVQVCGGISAPAGAIQVDVPVHANSNWLATMKHRFAGMIGMPLRKESDLVFRTVTGKSLADVPVNKLASVGKLKVFVNGAQVCMSKMPEIPIEYSLSKVANIQTWFQEAAAELPELIADHLLGKNEKEINKAIQLDGSVQTLIADHIKSSVSSMSSSVGGGGKGKDAWTEFVRVHHMNSPVGITQAESNRALQLVSKQLLCGFRDFVKAAAVPIGTYIQSMEAKKMERELKDNEDARHFAPVLGQTTAATRTKVTKNSGFKLYHKLAQDAFTTPVTQKSILEVLYNRTLPVAECRWYSYDEPNPSAGQTRTPSSNRTQAAPPVIPFGGGGGGGNGAGRAGGLGYLGRNPSPTAIQGAAAQINSLTPNQQAAVLAAVQALADQYGSAPSTSAARDMQANTILRTINAALYNNPALAPVQLIFGLEPQEVDMDVLRALAAVYGITLEDGVSQGDALRIVAYRVATIMESKMESQIYLVSQPDHLSGLNKEASGIVNALRSAAAGFANLFGGTNNDEDEEEDSPLPSPPPRDDQALTTFEDVSKAQLTVDQAVAAVKAAESERIRIGAQKPGVIMGALLRYDNASYFKPLWNTATTESIVNTSLADGDQRRQAAMDVFLKARLSDEATDFYLAYLGYLVQVNVKDFPRAEKASTILSQLHALHDRYMMHQEPIVDIFERAGLRGGAAAQAAALVATATVESESARKKREEAADLTKKAAAAAAVAKDPTESTEVRSAAAETARGSKRAAQAALQQAVQQETAAADHVAQADAVAPGPIPTPPTPPANVVVAPGAGPTRFEAFKTAFDALPLGASKADIDAILPKGNESVLVLKVINEKYKLGVQPNNSMRTAVLKKLEKLKNPDSEASSEQEQEKPAPKKKAVAKGPDLGKYVRTVTAEEARSKLKELYTGQDEEGDLLLPADKKNISAVFVTARSQTAVAENILTAFGSTANKKSTTKLDKSSWYVFQALASMFQLGLNTPQIDADAPAAGDITLTRNVKTEIIRAISDWARTHSIVIKASDLDLAAAIPMEAHHPWNAQIHHTLEPMAGAYPAYYNLMHTKMDMSKDAAYPGDVAKTYAAYHLFSGIPVMPMGTTIDPSKKSCETPIECHNSGDDQDEDEFSAAAIKSAAAATSERPPLKLFSQRTVAQKMRANLVAVHVESENTEDVDDELVGDNSYGLPMSIDAFE